MEQKFLEQVSIDSYIITAYNNVRSGGLHLRSARLKLTTRPINTVVERPAFAVRSRKRLDRSISLMEL